MSKTRSLVTLYPDGIANLILCLQAHVYGYVVRCLQYRLLHLLPLRNIRRSQPQPLPFTFRFQRCLVLGILIPALLHYPQTRKAQHAHDRRLWYVWLLLDHVPHHPLWHLLRIHRLRHRILLVLYFLRHRIPRYSVAVQRRNLASALACPWRSYHDFIKLDLELCYCHDDSFAHGRLGMERVLDLYRL